MLLSESTHLLGNLCRNADGDFGFALFCFHAPIIPLR
jgi:hypothetical protein